MVQLASLKRTPLFQCHADAGAKLVDFSGWEMPLQYGKVLEEHATVRNACGLFDISHMGLVTVFSGNLETTRAFLNRLVPQDLTKLVPGKAVYTQFLNTDGGILDDIIIYMLPENHPMADFKEFLVIVNAANADADVAWMKQHAETEVTIRPASAQYGLLALQGPSFAKVLTQAGLDESDLPKRFFVKAATLKLETESVPVLICRTGYTGEDGVELVAHHSQLSTLWQGLLTLGKPIGLAPIGLAARDTLRLEAAYPLHGQDITPDTTPLEAGLGWSVKLDQSADFIGKAALMAQKAKGLGRRFICMKLLTKSIARPHDTLLKNGVPVGEVTSGSISPTLNEPIAMGYVDASAISGSGDTIQVQVRGKAVDAVVVERPFYQPSR